MPWSLYPLRELIAGLPPAQAELVKSLWLDAVFMESTLQSIAGDQLDEQHAYAGATLDGLARAA